MSLWNCCQNPRIAEICQKHVGHAVSLFCSDKSCMEPMCVNCVSKHKEIHAKLNLQSPTLLDLREVEDFVIESTKKQIALIKEAKQKIHKPAEAIDKCIDRFFYGSTHRRQKLLQQRYDEMVSRFTPQLLVRSIESDHQYALSQGFAERFEIFLDELASEVAGRNAISSRQL